MNTFSDIIEEADKFARVEDIELLRKQAKMFDPLKVATIEDIKKLLNQNTR